MLIEIVVAAVTVSTGELKFDSKGLQEKLALKNQELTALKSKNTAIQSELSTYIENNETPVLKCGPFSSPDRAHCPGKGITYDVKDKNECLRKCEKDNAECCSYQALKKYPDDYPGDENQCTSSEVKIKSGCKNCTKKISFAAECKLYVEKK